LRLRNALVPSDGGPGTRRKEKRDHKDREERGDRSAVGEVFAFLTDVENWALLQPALREREREISRGPMKVGDTFRQNLEVPGQRVELLCEVVELEENERLSFEYTWDQLFLWIGLVVKPIDGGTRLAATGEGHMGGFLALFEPLVENEVNAQLSTGLVDLKNLLESRSTNK
jgi:Polyketide cyclase / dehydrase and lipid transport